MNGPDKTDQLVGRCPVCSPPSGAEGLSDAYVSKAMDGQGDENVYLYWSEYYQLHVCQQCLVDARNKIVDELRRDDDVYKEQERQHMGFVRHYTKNSLYS